MLRTIQLQGGPFRVIFDQKIAVVSRILQDFGGPVFRNSALERCCWTTVLDLFYLPNNLAYSEFGNIGPKVDCLTRTILSC